MLGDGCQGYTAANQKIRSGNNHNSESSSGDMGSWALGTEVKLVCYSKLTLFSLSVFQYPFDFLL